MKQQIKKQILINLPYALVGYVGNKISWLFQVIRTKSFGEKILYAMTHAELAFKNPLPSFDAKD